jgi:hypothetical protein
VPGSVDGVAGPRGGGTRAEDVESQGRDDRFLIRSQVRRLLRRPPFWSTVFDRITAQGTSTAEVVDTLIFLSTAVAQAGLLIYVTPAGPARPDP